MTPDPTSAALSDTLFSVAIGSYSLALLAFCAHLAFGRRPAPVLVGAGTGDAGPGPVRLHEESTTDPDRTWGRVGLALTGVGALAHAGVLLARALASQRIPLGNMYEFGTAAVLVGVVAFLVLALRSPTLQRIGLFVVGPAVLALVAIGRWLYAEAGPLVAALRSAWLGVHVTTATLGTGLFFVSGVTSVLYLLRRRADDNGSTGTLVTRLPAADLLDRTAHRTVVLGFPLWTFAVIAGAIWAESAWGRFWAWDPKETWAFISWVVYAAYLHARSTGGWRGRPAAWIDIVGFVTMVFNLLWVNLVAVGLHSYGGVG